MTAVLSRGRSDAPVRSVPGRPAPRRRPTVAPTWFLLPALVVYALVVLYPSLAGSVLAFTDRSGFDPGEWVGLANFEKLLRDDAARAALTNTVAVAVVITVVQTTLGLLLALALNSAIRARNLMRTLFFAPMMLSPIIVGLLWQYIYTPGGPLDSTLEGLGLGFLTRSWLGSDGALWAIVASIIWHHVGIVMAIYLAGLQSIPPELTEAAQVDGAGAVRRFWYVTRPLLGQSTTIVIALTLTASFKLFDQMFVMTGGGPGVSTQTLSLVMYQQAFVYGEYGYGTAIALVLTMIVAAVVFVQLSITRRGEHQV
ncbi:sugar ABC transporter permease [Agromyces sp. H66]|uniref:carbohydrate ABC transporter permease n=1 Tax=Agromyces sp. H66 TaxID=2529859 RepID=UPI0010AB0BB7|nr:sugar ABC transporter permease [Agromyces sp. H66]